MWQNKPTDLLLELPKDKIQAAQLQFRLHKGIMLSDEDILNYWTLFKSLYFDGIRWYPNEVDSHRHFVNWIKAQNIKELEQKKPGDFRMNIEEQYHKFLIDSHSIHSWPASSFYNQLVKDRFIENDEEATEGEKRNYILLLFKKAKEIGRRNIYGSH